jgi:hypothetical protein
MLKEELQELQGPALRTAEPLYEDQNQRVDDEPKQPHQQCDTEQLDPSAAYHGAVLGKR